MTAHTRFDALIVDPHEDTSDSPGLPPGWLDNGDGRPRSRGAAFCSAAAAAAVFLIPATVFGTASALGSGDSAEHLDVGPRWVLGATPAPPKYTASCTGGRWTVMSTYTDETGPGFANPIEAVRAVSRSRLFVRENSSGSAVVEALRPDHSVHGTYLLTRIAGGWRITGGRFCIE